MAISVVFVGMVFSLNKISEIEGTMAITGMLATASIGNATLTASVTSVTAISVPVSTINLGSLEPGQWNASENASYSHSGAIDGTDQWNSSNVTANITIQNDGSTNIDLEIYADDQATAGDGNFSGTAGCKTDNSCMMVRCGNVQNLNLTGGNCTQGKEVYTALPTAAGTEYVSNLNFTDTEDEAFIFVNVTVPEDEFSGSFTQTITFAATAVD
jgi:hypothetical protein